MAEDLKNMVRLQDISIGYKGRILFSKLNLEIAEGDIVAILGLNGTGKSSMLRTIGKLQKPLQGNVLIRDVPMELISANAFAAIAALVLTGRSEVIPALRVDELFSMARSPFTGFMHRLSLIDKTIIENITNDLQLQSFLQQPIYKLSDGEAQKVFIAKALIQDVPLILMDEPTSHLDIMNKLEIFSLVKNLADRGKTIIFASHEIELSLQVANKCLLLNHSGEFAFGETEMLIRAGRIQQFFNNDKFVFDERERKFVGVQK